jgi:RimJ/RimL family protein N-acetyltransferase
MPAWAHWANVAVCAAGGTCWELIAAGVPIVAVVVADNQAANARELEERGLALIVDPSQIADALQTLTGDSELRRQMIERGATLFDGRGAERVVAKLRERTIRLRPASGRDAECLFRWANDPAVRQQSFSPAEITWEEHGRWFAARLADPRTRLYIAENIVGEPIGQARYEIDAGRAVLSYSLNAACRGRRLAAPLLRLSARLLFHETAVPAIEGFVTPGNDASRRALERAGYALVGETFIRGQSAELWRLLREDAT